MRRNVDQVRLKKTWQGLKPKTLCIRDVIWRDVCMPIFTISPAAPVGNMRRILRSDWLPEQARWAHLAHLGLRTLIPRKFNIAWNGPSKLTFFGQCWRWSRKKVAEDSQNKENINDYRGLMCHKHNMPWIPALEITSRSWFLIRRNLFALK